MNQLVALTKVLSFAVTVNYKRQENWSKELKQYK